MGKKVYWQLEITKTSLYLVVISGLLCEDVKLFPGVLGTSLQLVAEKYTNNIEESAHFFWNTKCTGQGKINIILNSLYPYMP